MATVRIVNLQELEREIGKLSLGNRRIAMREALTRSSLVVARNAQKSIKPGGKGRPLRTKLTSRTGTGRRSIRADRPRVGRTISFADIGTDLRYMALHEVGGTVSVRAHSRRSPSGNVHSVGAHTATFPARPFLAPGLRKSRSEIERIFVATWSRAIRA